MDDAALDHISIAARSISDGAEFLAAGLGGERAFGGPAGDYRWWTWSFPDGERIEVIEPDGPPGGFVHRFLDRNGPGIHHVTFEVADLAATCARARSMGYAVVGESSATAAYREAFLHPKSAMGIVVQLTEPSSGEDDSAREPRMEPPPQPHAAQPPARIVGLRMRAADGERARRLWGQFLGAREESPTDGELIFRWPDSPMRVRVLIARDGGDRSDAIELADPPTTLPSGAHPVLGVRFEVVAPGTSS